MFSRAVASFSIAFVVAVALARGVAWAGSTSAQTWLVASDIHLDPSARSTDPSLVGSDTNPALLDSLLVQMKQAVRNPSVVLLPGDFFAHDFAKIVRHGADAGAADDEGIRTMASIAAGFSRTFPRAQFAIALGNNDAPCGDYRSEFGTRYLQEVARIWAPLVDRNGAAPDFALSFARDGFYTATLPLPGWRLVAFDDVPLSSIYFGDCGAGAASGDSVLAEVQAALAGTPPGTRNVVMMHIPPGYDPLLTREAHGFLPWSFLNSRANAALVATLAAPQSRVAFVVSGHVHRFDVRLAASVPIVVFGSVSPVGHNNPAFYALHLDGDGSLRDIDTYAYDEWSQEWQPPRSFDAKWRIDRVDGASLARLHAMLATDPAMRATWDAQSNAFPSNRAIAASTWGPGWRVAWCAQTELTGGFAGCANVENRARLLPLLIAGAVAAVLGVLAGLGLMLRRLLARGPRGV